MMKCPEEKRAFWSLGTGHSTGKGGGRELVQMGGGGCIRVRGAAF